MLILLTRRFLPFLYRGECAAFDPEAPGIPIRVVTKLTLISPVPQDTAALAMVIITRRVSTLFCPDPLGSVRVVHLDLPPLYLRPLPLENESLTDT
jgi:hypothetical protein